MNTRESLVNKLISVFKDDPTTYKIVLYGSDAKQTVDQYSDIDIVVFNSDIARIERDFLSILSQIGAIRNFFYYIDGVDNHLSVLLWFKTYSAYFRVDLAIVPSEETYGESFPEKPTTLVYEDLSKKREITFKNNNPQKGTLYWMNVAISNLVGFAKQKNRNDLGVFRYWNATVLEMLIYFLLEQKNGYPENESIESPKVSTISLKHTRKELEEFDEQLEKIVPRSLQLNLSQSFYEAFVFLYDVMNKRAKHYKSEFITKDVFEFYRDFFEGETKE